MRTWLQSILSIVIHWIGNLLALAATHAAVQSEDCQAHYYGSESQPQLEIKSEESEGSPPFLQIEVLDGSGVGTRAITRLPKPDDSRKAKTGLELAGTNRLQGREFRYRAIVSRDRTTLEVLEPKTILLADGTELELAGRYDDLSEKTRALSAKAAFDPIDKELNVVYGKLTATLDPAGQQELRTEQRRWLKYRDFTIYDGDDSNLIGPGTAPHFRQQGRRTLERIEFLKALLAGPAQPEAGHTLYSDGRGGSFAVGRVDAAVFFAAMIDYPKLNSADASSDLPCGLSGLARAAGENSWFAKAEDMVATERSWTGEPLRLVFDPAGKLRVGAAGAITTAGALARVVGGSYHRLRALVPAEEPLRSLLWQLPATAFQETTEGLTTAEKKALALTGEGGTFKIEKETPDQLVLRHHDGTVELRRLKGDDGAAVMAVEQTNGPRNHTMQLWRKASAGTPFTLWENVLPKPPVETFFAEDLGADAAKIKENSRYVILFEKGAGLHVHLDVMLKTPQPDYSYTLEWDGFGFAAERNASIILKKPTF